MGAILALGPITSHSGLDLSPQVRGLAGLARRQGYLTVGNIHEALRDHLVSKADMAAVHRALGELDIEIIDQSEAKAANGHAPPDYLDDPLQVYLSQLQKSPPPTHEEQVDLFRRLEEATRHITREIYSLGFTAKEHLALAEKLLSRPPTERFDRVVLDTKATGRDRHLRSLRELVKHVRRWDLQADEKYAAWQGAKQRGRRESLLADLQAMSGKLQEAFPKFCYRPRVIEDLLQMTEQVHQRLQSKLGTAANVPLPKANGRLRIGIGQSEIRSVRDLERFVRLPCQEFLGAYSRLQQLSESAAQAKNEIVERNLRLVVYAARNYVNRGLPLLMVPTTWCHLPSL